MRKYITLWLVSLFVVLALPAFAQDTTTNPSDGTSEPALQPTAESMTQEAPASQTTARPVSLNGEEVDLGDYISANFVRLGEVIQASGLVDTLNSGEYTVFVPNDGAFTTLLNELDISLDDLMENPVLLTGLTNYHVVPGRITTEDIMDGKVEALETVNGAAIIFGYDDATSRVTLNDGAASIEQPDVVLGNGIVHVIDNVLLPPNIHDLLAGPSETEPTKPEKSLEQISEDSFVVLTEAVKAAGLEDELSRGEYTLFAPNDGAFVTLLNDEQMSYADLLANQSMLQNILEYHLVPGTITAEEITNGDVTSVKTANGATLNFGYDNTISRVSINGGEATIEQPDIFASNGVVHVIDNVLLPPQAG